MSDSEGDMEANPAGFDIPGTVDISKVDPDPALVEIVRNQLHDVAEEMQASVMNSAYSPLWQEAGDLSCAVVTPSAEIVGQSERVVPIHIATMTSSIRAAIEGTGGHDALEPGDMLLQNDPYSGNNHLPDFVMARPIFVADALLGFAAVRAHWVDIGGSSPTSYSTQTGEIIKEGLRVPPAKLYEAGKLNDGLRSVILANTRDRDERVGDMHAQISGVRRGHDRLLELAEKHGVESLAAAMNTVLSNDERLMRNRISELPDGTYEAVDYLDGDGMTDELIRIQTALRVDGDEISVDFAGSDDQVSGGVNSPIACTRTATYYAVKVTLDPGKPGTTGSYRPISVTAPSGSVVNPEYPAPVVAGNHETATRVHDAVLRAIVEIDPELGFGAGDGSSNVFNYSSLESGALNYTCMGGGMGACPGRDGINAIRSGVGNTGIQMIERVEETYDFVTVEEFSIVADTGGPGRNRGGCTVRRILRFDDPTMVVTTGERAKTQPFGVDGGEDGASAVHRLIHPDGEEETLPSKVTREVAPGARVHFQPAGGGGFGDPTDRPAEGVAEDVRNGYVSLAAAREAYGVVLDEETLEVDREATEDLRE
ncbi:MAG: hydantoinase B/oxoprolinase family protein [Halobacteriota archaeon]|uniref:hydantoinase B/oxoprolinase family protein n=1 Tax=Natronomonas sp. TaxID=2184060 RepID=UPI0039750560